MDRYDEWFEKNFSDIKHGVKKENEVKDEVIKKLNDKLMKIKEFCEDSKKYSGLAKIILNVIRED